MKNYTIPYSRDVVIPAVEQITGYTGKYTPDGFDRIAATNDEMNILEVLLDESLDELARKFPADYLAVLDEKSHSITISNSSNFTDQVIPTITAVLNDILTNDVAARWFHIAREEADAKVYSERAAACFLSVPMMLLQRKRPLKNGCCGN